MDYLDELSKEVQEMGNPKMAINGHHQMKGFNYENGDIYKPESFVVDLESVSSDVDNALTSFFHTNNSNSRITLQRSLSKKVSQHGTGRNYNDRDTLAPSSSPKAMQVTGTPLEKSPQTTSSMGSQESFGNNQYPQHQITIKTGNTNAIPEGRLGRRSSFKRSPPSWFYDPKRILFFFATVSSMGTMLLILLTLSVSKRNEIGGIWGWQ